METVLLDLGASGKRDVEGASGGMGLAKAAIFLLGHRTTVQSVTVEDGKLVRHTFSATPEELLSDQGAPPISTVAKSLLSVGGDWKIGTSVAVELKGNSQLTDAREFLNKVRAFSPAAVPIEMSPERVRWLTPPPPYALDDWDKRTFSDPQWAYDLDLYSSRQKKMQQYGAAVHVANHGAYQFEGRAGDMRFFSLSSPIECPQT